MMRNFFIITFFILTGCVNEELVALDKQYSNVEVEIPRNCFFLSNHYFKDYADYFQYTSSFRHINLLEKEHIYQTLYTNADDEVFDKLLRTCEICEQENPKYAEYKEKILKIKKSKEQEIKAKEEELRKQKENEKRKAEISKKYGYEWCSNKIDDNCIVEDLSLQVIQQTSEGTLVETITGKDFFNLFLGAPLLSEKHFFVVANPKDSNKADGSILDSGIFVFIGIQQYQSLIGTRTVKKLKRLQ